MSLCKDFWHRIRVSWAHFTEQTFPTNFSYKYTYVHMRYCVVIVCYVSMCLLFFFFGEIQKLPSNLWLNEFATDHAIAARCATMTMQQKYWSIQCHVRSVQSNANLCKKYTATTTAASRIKIRAKYWVIIKNCKWIKNPHHTTHTNRLTHAYTHTPTNNYLCTPECRSFRMGWNSIETHPTPCRYTICFLNGYVNVLTVGIMLESYRTTGPPPPWLYFILLLPLLLLVCALCADFHFDVGCRILWWFWNDFKMKSRIKSNNQNNQICTGGFAGCLTA